MGDTAPAAAEASERSLGDPTFEWVVLAGVSGSDDPPSVDG